MSPESNPNNHTEILLTRSEFLKQGLAKAIDLGKKSVASQIDLQHQVAVIEVTECTAFKGSGCKTCYEVCPLPDEAIQIIENLPHIIASGCTGCSICVHACPTQNAIELTTIQKNAFQHAS